MLFVSFLLDLPSLVDNVYSKKKRCASGRWTGLACDFISSDVFLSVLLKFMVIILELSHYLKFGVFFFLALVQLKIVILYRKYEGF